VHQFVVACDCSTGDRVDHGVGVILKIQCDFGVLHEHACCVNCAEQSLLRKDKYVHGMLGDKGLLCASGNGCPCGLWSVMGLDL
jgi:hypothetical protein